MTLLPTQSYRGHPCTYVYAPSSIGRVVAIYQKSDSSRCWNLLCSMWQPPKGGGGHSKQVHHGPTLAPLGFLSRNNLYRSITFLTVTFVCVVVRKSDGRRLMACIDGYERHISFGSCSTWAPTHQFAATGELACYQGQSKNGYAPHLLPISYSQLAAKNLIDVAMLKTLCLNGISVPAYPPGYRYTRWALDGE